MSESLSKGGAVENDAAINYSRNFLLWLNERDITMCLLLSLQLLSTVHSAQIPTLNFVFRLHKRWKLLFFALLSLWRNLKWCYSNVTYSLVLRAVGAESSVRNEKWIMCEVQMRFAILWKFNLHLCMRTNIKMMTSVNLFCFWGLGTREFCGCGLELSVVYWENWWKNVQGGD